MMVRQCEICGCPAKDFLTQVAFVCPDQGRKKKLSYDVVACRECGFLYADNVPSQKEMNGHYKNSEKYTYNASLPRGLERLYGQVYAALSCFIVHRYRDIPKSELRIMDIGCSIGHILHLLQREGYRSVMGIEPSQECCRLAKAKYGLSLFNGVLSEYPVQAKYQMVLLTGVLEHIRDLNTTIQEARHLLAEDGTLAILVPNAARFSQSPQAPFDEFSLEHVNYFTGRSLDNLLGKHGLQRREARELTADFYDSHLRLAFYGRRQAAWRKDTAGKTQLERYVAASRRRVSRCEKKLRRVLEQRGALVVWGAGSLTARLLSTTCLGRARITAFIDSNKGLWGKILRGVPIVSPDYMNQNTPETIFIGSYIYRHEIAALIKQKYNYKGPVITL
jgi:SAM-dependent methyltransferase